MRTTVELPPDLMRAAKARSAERGESLKTLLTRAVEAELGGFTDRRRRPARVALPLFGDPSGPRVPITPVALEIALAEDDARLAGGRATRARHRRRSR